MKKFKTALELLCDETTSLDKIQKVSALIKGLNPSVDKHLESISKLITKIQQIQGGDVVTLSAEKLPEHSKKQKKLKKYLLLLIGHWQSLQSEVAQISQLQAANSLNLTTTGKIIATAKGPLGVITIAAAAIVAVSTFLNSQAVNITVQNTGCRPIQPVMEQRIDLPGLKLPSTTINTGGQGLVVIPAIDLNVNASQAGIISLSAFNFSKSFDQPSELKDVIYDGQSLLGKTTTVKLSSSKTHTVVIKCNP